MGRGYRRSEWEERVEYTEERERVKEEGYRERGKDEDRYERVCGLLEDFPNLNVGGLLPDPDLKRKREHRQKH